MRLPKKFFNRFMKKKSGRRFIYAYLAINAMINRNIVIRLVFFFLGILSLLIGVVLLFIPGPGVLFIFLGGMMLCTISRKIAQFFDRLEVDGKRIFHRATRSRFE